MSKYSNELHITYQQGISAFLEIYPIKDNSVVKEIDALAECVLWHFGINLPMMLNYAQRQ